MWFNHIRYGLLALTLMANTGYVMAHDGNPNNKLVEFENHGAWEIWCIDYGGTGDIRCNLNLVIVYKPRPDFRALITRVYVNDGQFRFEINTEWQTSLSRGHLKFDDSKTVSLAPCDSPCAYEGDEADALLELMKQSDSAMIRFHDYVVQTFDLDLPLDGIANGLQRLVALQEKYSS